MKKRNQEDYIPTDAELREQYARTGLEAARGITFERAMQVDVIRLCIVEGVRARRRIQARRQQMENGCGSGLPRG